ncbi:MAG TPA: hypothetical protein DCX71_00265 [Erythrobacter sp.]|jgi:hypothetical protein|uniref:Uncharacterized protein n=2 Tax=Qipengyuania citrea TaxID=225971 RepID=A0A6I4UDK4_9SPHN|nr:MULTISPECIES: hypothetical protein [Erythrobacteraceae]MAC30279.1 hypothetical protein [Erythrobacter sp.]MAG05550.1 hypothetical protein [Sphingomonadaceae bacterium]MBN92324.1 hypothetical protein [Erythrobacteraceae bacterium]MCZ4265157.1 hypothetical protein [Erythrobacter sp. G21629-S1]KNH02387.1 Prolipoprotein diacylglyceryl transferase [Qipengyuania citrea LAMA 915]|tara:strand:+ start:2140 stop:2361 length:222 start_codon:yes stop_codon:yes gene_type:complete
MLNLLSILLGLLSLVIVIPATIPLLGWANWLALPLIVLGVVVGQLSSTNGGRNFCLVVLLIAAIRLSIGGGLI